MAMVFGGSIRFSTADFRVGEYPKSLSYPAHLKIRGKVERRTTTLTQGAPLRPEATLRSCVRCAYHNTTCPRGLIGAQSSDKMKGKAFYLGNVG